MRDAFVKEALALVDDVIKKHPADRIARSKAEAVKARLAGSKPK